MEGRMDSHYLPLLAPAFSPLSQLTLEQAQCVFAALGVVCLALSCWLLNRLAGLTGWRTLALVGAVLLNGPLYYSFKEGNLTHFLLLILVAAAGCIAARREHWLGVLLALAGLIKLPLFLLLVYYAFRRRWRVLASAAAFLVCLRNTMPSQ